jgi:transcription elongation factor GreA
MSKAFTKENDETGFAHSTARSRGQSGPVTPIGARIAKERLHEIAERIEHSSRAEDRAALEAERERLAAVAAAPVGSPGSHDVVAFGAQVAIRDAFGKERLIVVASSSEVGLVPHAATASSPIARALLGAHPGDVVEYEGPRGLEELTVVEVLFPN